VFAHTLGQNSASGLPPVGFSMHYLATCSLTSEPVSRLHVARGSKEDSGSLIGQQFQIGHCGGTLMRENSGSGALDG